MKHTKKAALGATSLALIAGTVFPTISESDPHTVNWDLIVKDPVMLSSEAPTLPASIGDRIHISTLESEFNGVGRILNNGRNHCTGNIVTIDGYSTVSEGILVSTAAHCVDDGLQSDDLTFTIDFIDDNGATEVHTFANPLIWGNANYQNTGVSSNAAQDQALLFFPHQQAPATVIPSELQIFSPHFMRDWGNAELRNNIVTSAGYSQDMNGLSTDRDCEITTVYASPNGLSPYIKADCSLHKGASGSGLISDIRDDGQLIISAITSAKSSSIEVTDEDFRSYFAMMYHHNLMDVPFLIKDEICARVTAPSGLFVRSEDYNEPDSAYASLAFNQIVFVTDMLEDEQEIYGADDIWIEIRTLNNPDPQTPNGYSNSAWLEPTPCPSR